MIPFQHFLYLQRAPTLVSFRIIVVKPRNAASGSLAAPSPVYVVCAEVFREPRLMGCASFVIQARITVSQIPSVSHSLKVVQLNDHLVPSPA